MFTRALSLYGFGGLDLGDGFRLMFWEKNSEIDTVQFDEQICSKALGRTHQLDIFSLISDLKDGLGGNCPNQVSLSQMEFGQHV